MKRTVFMSMTTLGLLFFSCGLFAQSAEQIRKKQPMWLIFPL